MQSIRTIAASLLLFIVLISAMKNVALLVFYQFDTSGFVKVFCENKARPQLECNGKCKLSQIIQEKQQKEASETLASLQSEVFLFFQPVQPLLKTAIPIQLQVVEYRLVDTDLNRFPFLDLSGKPPQAIAV